jgi:hypothetical protein
MGPALEYSWTTIAIALGAFAVMYTLLWLVFHLTVKDVTWERTPPPPRPERRECPRRDASAPSAQFIERKIEQ